MGCAIVLVEAEAVLVDVIEDGDEHAQARKEQDCVGPEGLPAQVPVEQTAHAEQGQGQGYEQTDAAVVGVDAVVAERLQERERHAQTEDAADELGRLVELLFHSD